MDNLTQDNNIHSAQNLHSASTVNPTQPRTAASARSHTAPSIPVCDQCGKAQKRLKQHKQLCHPTVLHSCTQPGCNHSTGRKDVANLHLGTVHDIYLPGDKKARSIALVHLTKKTVEALRIAYGRDSNELNRLKAEFARWEALRVGFEHPDSRMPLLDEMTTLPVVSDPAVFHSWTKFKLIGELIDVRSVLFGPDFGEPGSWNAYEEVTAVAQHVEALRRSFIHQQQSGGVDMEDGATEADLMESQEMEEQLADEQTVFQIFGAMKDSHFAEGRFIERLAALRGQRAAEDLEMELLVDMEDDA